MGDFAGHPFRGNQWTQASATMTGGELTKAQEKVDAAYEKTISAIYDKATHGHERYSEIVARLAADPAHMGLLREHEQASRRRMDLVNEVQARAGGTYTRLPHGVGRERRINPDRNTGVPTGKRIPESRQTGNTVVQRGDYRPALSQKIQDYIKERKAAEDAFVGPPLDPFRGFR